MRELVAAILISAGLGPRIVQRRPGSNVLALDPTVGGWRLSGNGYQAVRVKQNCWHSRGCMLMSGPATAPDDSFGNLYQIVPSDTRLARRIRFRAAIRVDGAGTRARLWLRQDRGDGGVTFHDSSEITPGGWIYQEIEAEILPNSRQIAVGFLLSGSGKAWIDDASLIEVKQNPPQSRPRGSDRLMRV